MSRARMDPYRTLNVPRSADQAAIKQAYRKLAKMLHPDRNPGSARAEQRFKEVSQAYDLLSDPVKRARYDRGEIDAEGRPQQTFRGFEFADDPQSAAESIFGKMFGGAFGRGFGGPPGEGLGRGRSQFRFDDLRREAAGAASAGARRPQRGADRRYRLEVDFATAALGGKQRLHLDGGRAIEVVVPPGAEHGSTLRLKGQGDRGSPGGAAGDALVEIAIRPHPSFTRQGHDVHVELPISVPEAILGASVPVPTIDGQVRITVPAGSNSGRTLRLRGRGIVQPDGHRGDQYVRLLVVLPQAPDSALEAWARRRNYDVRRNHEPR
ncbi:MAG TPA: J domain-containing protein [Geminicoccaceae bacterium]|nr:J domain-containing protein [Geminicoccaceae bacterium]